MDYYMHILPGRIRIRSSILRNNDSKILSVSQCLKSIQGVVSVRENKTVGSVLIHYDKRNISYQRILKQLAQQEFMPVVTWSSLKVRSLDISKLIEARAASSKILQ